jgi:D-alanyl-D-alanine carboxypeptidase/D-alanyl-D-alanine-endopeptidase (penicillin-binding protein 4)
MAEGDRPHSEETARRRLLPRVLKAVAGTVVVLALVAGAVYVLDLDEQVLGTEQPDPRRDPAAVEPPPGLDLPAPAVPSPVADTLASARPDPAAVRRALGGLLDDPRLGPRVGFAVAGIDGRPVLSEGPAVVTPASLLKLLTCLAALETMGPEHRFSTSVVGSGRDVVLVGGGDPLLASEPAEEGTYPARADLATLADATARQLRRDGRERVRLGYDDTLFAGPEASPGWESDYLPDDVVSPITALWVDEGLVSTDDDERSVDPSAAAADLFATQLRRRGVVVVGDVLPTPAGPGAKEIASVQGAELVEVVQHVLELSDNEAAEVLARHVALAEDLPGSFEAAGQAITDVVRGLGVRLPGAVVLDGSGLARGDRLAVRSLLEVLAVGAEHEDPELGGLVEGLPVAGFSGSLGYRFTNAADDGLGWVRAKTGTLTGVHGMAGVVTGADGTLMLFVTVADRVPVINTTFTRDRLDQVAAALAACACSG